MLLLLFANHGIPFQQYVFFYIFEYKSVLLFISGTFSSTVDTIKKEKKKYWKCAKDGY